MKDHKGILVVDIGFSVWLKMLDAIEPEGSE
jgi:hypothetical protein